MADDRDFGGTRSYPSRSPWVQRLCPAPKRFLQDLIAREGMLTGVDIGCGVRSPLSDLRPLGFRTIGIDSNPVDLEEARKLGGHDEYLCADLRSPQELPRVDVIVMSHVIEHFERDDAMALLAKIERAASRLVYIETPYGFLEQGAREGNVYQRHLSGWFPHDFESRGYTVFGSSMRLLQGPMGAPRYFSPGVTHGINRMTQWYWFRHPRSARVISALRYKDKNGDLRSIPRGWTWALAGTAELRLRSGGH